jgi:NADH dehydrogenase (ubiquinone) 1 alpha subcomplex subunit 6
MPVAAVRTKIRQEFERHRYEKSLDISNVIYLKGQMEFQELVNFWKQHPHVMRYFEHHGESQVFDTKPQLQSEFVDKFLRGN